MAPWDNDGSRFGDAMPNRKLILLRVEADDLPEEPGDAKEMDIPLDLLTDMTEWKVISHNISIHTLDGSAIFSLVVEEP